MTKACTGVEKEDCREELISQISKRPSTAKILGILSIPLTVVGIIIVLVSMLYEANTELTNLAIKATSEIVLRNRDWNARQEERLRLIEINHANLQSEIKAARSDLSEIKQILKRRQVDGEVQTRGYRPPSNP